jgi:hypothetical protein
MEVNCGQLKKDTKIFVTAEMKYLRTIKGCSRLHHLNKDYIRKEMKIHSAQNKTDLYI